jgi:regulatory protein
LFGLYSEIDSSDVRQAAMDLLARREHSVKELRDKLHLRFEKRAQKRAQKQASAGDPNCAESTFPENASHSITGLIETEVNKLRLEGLQSDARLAEAYIRSRSNRGHGPLKISSELRNKAVSERIVSAALSESGIDWGLLIEKVTIRKYGECSLNGPLDMAFKAKRNRFLIQRGFSYEHIALLN